MDDHVRNHVLFRNTFLSTVNIGYRIYIMVIQSLGNHILLFRITFLSTVNIGYRIYIMVKVNRFICLKLIDKDKIALQFIYYVTKL